MSHVQQIPILIKEGRQRTRSARHIRQVVALYKKRLQNGGALSAEELSALFTFLESECAKLTRG